MRIRVGLKLLQPFILLFLFCIPGLLGLFHPGFFVSDDGNWMVIRFSAFYEVLRHGQFPVRFLPRLLNGFGYPVADFLYPLFMYIGVPIHVLGFSFVNTIKIVFGLSFLGSVIFSYLWLKKMFDSISAFLGALVYAYFPYHLWDMYKRGSIGEVLALGIVPFIFWQIEGKNWLLVSLGIGLLIVAHNTLALLFLPVILLYYYLKQRRLSEVLFSLLFGLGLSTFFWLPALFDKQFTVFDTKTVADISQYFLSLSQINLLGYISIIALVGGLFVLKQKNYIFWLFYSVFVVSVFLSLPFSGVLWKVIPGQYIQFPFRFLSLSSICSGFIIASIFSFISKKNKLLEGSIVALLVGFSALPVLVPISYQLFPDSWYSTNQDSTTVQNEYLPKWVKQVPQNKTSVAEIVDDVGTISQSSSTGEKITLVTNSSQNSILTINTIYFPGWVAKVDDAFVNIRDDNAFGLMQVAISKGQHRVNVYFTETPLRLFADVISLISFIVLGVVGWIRYKRK